MRNGRQKNLIILVVSITIIIIVLIIGTLIAKKQEKAALNNNDTKINIEESNNVNVVDEKLKNGDYRVTQSYLLNYTKNKSNVWYSSKGIITKITIKDNNAIITIRGEKDKKKVIKGYIDRSSLTVKEKDKVYFVGSIDLSDGYLNLARISKDTIDYSNVVEISVEDLNDNIYNLKNTYVIVSGYMITAGDKYKLYSSKSDYKKDEEIGNYFLLEWAGKFNYTGTSEVLVRCFIGDRYKLVGCEIEK